MMQSQMHLCALIWMQIGSSQVETGELEKQNVTLTEMKTETGARTSLPKMEVHQSKSCEHNPKLHCVWKWIAGIPVPEALRTGRCSFTI